MSRELMRLTHDDIDDPKIKPGLKRVMLCDGGGLYLQVSLGNSGAIHRSWIFRYAINGHTHQMGLGGSPDISIEDARVRAADARLCLIRGECPMFQKKLEKKKRIGDVLNNGVYTYTNSFDGKWTHRYMANWHSLWQRYVAQTIGQMPMGIITSIDIDRLVHSTSFSNRIAKLLRGMIEAVLDANGFTGRNHSRWNETYSANKVRPSKNESFGLS